MFTDLSNAISTYCCAPMIDLKITESIFMNAKAVIIQGYGMGNVQILNKKFMDIIQRAINNDSIIVVMTQCYQGEVSDVYETGRILIDMGAVLAYDMTLECCFAKLSYLLGKKYSTAKIKTMMMTNLKGELTDRKKFEKFSLKNSKMIMAIC